jgi:hypothetical protein
MKLLQSEFGQFIAVLAVLWLFLEAALGLGVLRAPTDQGAQIAYFLLLISVSYNIVGLGKLIRRPGLSISTTLPESFFHDIKTALTDNDYKVLLHLESQRNELPIQTLVAVFGSYKGTKQELNSFTRRLVHLTSLGLITTVGGSEIAITETGLRYLSQTRQDPKYHHLVHPS